MIHLLVHVEERYRLDIDAKNFFRDGDLTAEEQEFVLFETGSSDPPKELNGKPLERVLWPIEPYPDELEDDEQFFIPSKSIYQEFAWVCPWFRDNEDRLRTQQPVLLSGGKFADCLQSMFTILNHLQIKYHVCATF